MSEGSPHRRPLKQAALAFLLMLIVSVVVYSVLWVLDFAMWNDWVSPLELIQDAGAAQTLTNLGEVTVGILGVAITVVAIIVELAANRYTPRITELFLRDPVNGLVIGFFAVTSVLVLWVDMSLFGPHHPEWMAAAVTVGMTMSLLLLLPYFIYVFDFLAPTSIIAHIRVRGTDAIRRVARGSRRLSQEAGEVRFAVDQLGDVAQNSVDNNDKAIALAAVGALADVATSSVRARPLLPVDWFDAEKFTAQDHDFVALHPDMVHELARRRIWVEMKVLRQFQSIFTSSLGGMRDVAHVVAIHTKRLAVLAANLDDPATLRLTVRFLNTYLRAAINARDIRTGYNLLNEYRSLAEHLVRCKQDALATQVVEWFKFYGQTAFQQNLSFLLETAAYDLCAILEIAHGLGSAAHDPMLAIFLDVDREPEDSSTQEAALRGVRKAQVKLATYYLARGDEKHARLIFEDMRHELPVRLRSIREEMLSISDPEYWEVSDRGINFDWLPPDRRDKLDHFFGWFPNLTTKGTVSSS